MKNNPINKINLGACGIAFCLGTVFAFPVEATTTTNRPTTVTADDQMGTSKADVETTRRIREAIIDNDKFSSDAKNITIVTRDGNVTLEGDVESAAEKSSVNQIAERIVKKPYRVTNRTVVKPD